LGGRTPDSLVVARHFANAKAPLTSPFLRKLQKAEVRGLAGRE